MYAADHRFWIAYHARIVRAFRGELWSCSQGARDEFGVLWVPCDVDRGLNLSGEKINTGCNSGFQAVHLAALFQGVTLPEFRRSRIILLGFDMQRTGGRSHCHGDHVKGLPNGSNFRLWMDHFRVLARDLQSTGVEVVNCSRETAMQCFPRLPLAEAFKQGEPADAGKTDRSRARRDAGQDQKAPGGHRALSRA